MVPPSIASSSTAAAGTSQTWNEGLALFILFAILFLLSVNSVTAKFALWVAIAIAALVWLNAIRPPAAGQPSPAATFWQALAR